MYIYVTIMVADLCHDVFSIFAMKFGIAKTKIRHSYCGWFGTLLCVVLALATARQSAKRSLSNFRVVVPSLTMHAKRRVLVRRVVAMSHCYIIIFLWHLQSLLAKSIKKNRIINIIGSKSFSNVKKRYKKKT
jgi:hypothetical protein